MTGVKVDKTLIKIKRRNKMKKECWLCKHKKNIAKVLYNIFLFIVLFLFVTFLSLLPIFDHVANLKVELTIENFWYIVLTVDGILSLLATIVSWTIFILFGVQLRKNALNYIENSKGFSRAARFCAFWNPFC